MKLLHLADIHYDSRPHELHDMVQGYFWPWLEEHKNEYDMIVTSGDLVCRGVHEIEELAQCKAKLDAVGIPYLPVPGNHDLMPLKKDGVFEERTLEETNYGRVFGEDGLRCVRYIGGLKLIGFAIRNEDPDGQLAWLEQELKEPIPKLVFCHYAVVPVRKAGWAEWWGFVRIGTNKEPIAELIKNPEHRVVAYFCGHFHINALSYIGSVPQVLTGALGEELICFREIEIENDIMKITTKHLPPVTEYVGTLPSQDQSFDEDHPTIYGYFWGNENEREIVIDFSHLR